MYFQDILGILGKGDWPLHKLKQQILYGWKFPPNSMGSHWLLQGHMTSHNEMIFRHNLWMGNIVKSMIIFSTYIEQININIWSNAPDIMTSESNSALLPAK